MRRTTSFSSAKLGSVRSEGPIERRPRATRSASRRKVAGLFPSGQAGFPFGEPRSPDAVVGEQLFDDRERLGESGAHDDAGRLLREISPKGNLIGVWKAYAGVGRVLLLERDGDLITLRTRFEGGKENVEETRVESIGNVTRYRLVGNRFGEYLEVDARGSLWIYDREDLVRGPLPAARQHPFPRRCRVPIRVDVSRSRVEVGSKPW